MDTLLAANQNAALIGTLDGGIRTARREPAQPPAEWLRGLSRRYKAPDHAPKVADHVRLVRAGGDRVSSFAGGFIPATDERYPVRDHVDEDAGLSVRAAFITPSPRWVVADL